MEWCCPKKTTKPKKTKLAPRPPPNAEEELEINKEKVEEECDDTNFTFKVSEVPYLWYPSLQSVKQIEYVRKLESEFACLQKAYLTLTTQFARMQFRLRQIIVASPCERDALLLDLEKLAFEGNDEVTFNDELPRIQRDLRCMGDVRRKQADILENLRSHLTALAEASEIEGIEYEPESDYHNNSACPGSSVIPRTRRSSQSNASESLSESTATISSQTGSQAPPSQTTGKSASSHPSLLLRQSKSKQPKLQLKSTKSKPATEKKSNYPF